jgi:hypothetical protein
MSKLVTHTADTCLCHGRGREGEREGERGRGGEKERGREGERGREKGRERERERERGREHNLRPQDRNRQESGKSSKQEGEKMFSKNI